MSKVDDAIASFERNIEAQTGRAIADWLRLLDRPELEKHGQMVAWLKSEHGLSHGYANHLAKARIQATTPRSDADPVAHLFEGGKEGLRPLYDRVVELALALGPDVEIAAKKSNVSLRRNKQFALVQPSTKTRLDLGLILKGRPAEGRLEPSGSFNAMFTHRVKLATLEDIDGELGNWLRHAYEAAV